MTAPGYRADIDGLRALAVLAVLLFHAELGCMGGYVGVDVFFVISGFLITSLIWRDLETGRFTFGNFSERRARRILPAMSAVAIATLSAGWFVLLPDDFASLGRAALALAAFGANVYYWQATGYFDGAAQEQALLHTWSLAVEEQFYFCAPFALWAMHRSRVLGDKRTVARVAGLVLLASLALSAYGVARFPSSTFYLLPTRAWELLAGSLAALVPAPRWLSARRAVRECLAATGLALVLAPVFLYSATTPFPGLAALPPCLGTALLIRANERAAGTPETALARLLSAGPLVFVGSISYSLYLIHWPILAFARYLAPAPLALGARAGLLGLALLLAWLSYRYVETPFRTRALGASRGAMFASAGAGLALLLFCGGLCVAQAGFPQRLPARSLEYARIRSDRTYVHELSLEHVRAGELVPIGAQAPPPSVLVWGDSHAMAALPAFHALLEERGLAGRAATHSSTAPVLDWHLERTEWGLREESRAYNRAVLHYARRHRIRDVVLIARWSLYADCGPEGTGPFEPALVDTVRQLVAGGSRAFILLDVPSHSFDVPAALARAVLSGRDLAPFCARPESTRAFDGLEPAAIEAVRAAGGTFIDPKPAFLDPARRYYLVEVEGTAFYRDEGHLTSEGARRMLVPLLREALPLGSRPAS